MRFTKKAVPLSLLLIHFCYGENDFRYNAPCTLIHCANTVWGNFNLGANFNIQERLSSGVSFAQKIENENLVSFQGLDLTDLGWISLNDVDRPLRTNNIEFDNRWDFGYELLLGWESVDCRWLIECRWDHNNFESTAAAQSHFSYENFLRDGVSFMGASFTQTPYFAPAGEYITSPWNSLYSNLYLNILNGDPNNFDQTSFFVKERAYGNWTTKWDLVRAQIARCYSVHRYFSLKPFAEFQLHLIRHGFRTTVEILQDDDERLFDTNTPFAFKSYAVTTQKEYAMGLNVGFEPRFHMGRGVSLFGSVDLGLLVTNNRVEYREQVSTLNYTIEGANIVATPLNRYLSYQAENKPLKQVLHLKLGFEWHEQCGHLYGVAVRAGWDLFQYLNHYYVPKNWVDSEQDPKLDLLDPVSVRPVAFPNNKSTNGDLMISGLFFGITFFY